MNFSFSYGDFHRLSSLGLVGSLSQLPAERQRSEYFSLLHLGECVAFERFVARDPRLEWEMMDLQHLHWELSRPAHSWGGLFRAGQDPCHFIDVEVPVAGYADLPSELELANVQLKKSLELAGQSPVKKAQALAEHHVRLLHLSPFPGHNEAVARLVTLSQASVVFQRHLAMDPCTALPPDEYAHAVRAAVAQKNMGPLTAIILERAQVNVPAATLRSLRQGKVLLPAWYNPKPLSGADRSSDVADNFSRTLTPEGRKMMGFSRSWNGGRPVPPASAARELLAGRRNSGVVMHS